MVYGPIAAYWSKHFHKIRYTALSLPYHIGNGVFGGLLPVIGLTVVARTGNIYAGLYYPIVVASLTFVVGSLLLKETHNVLIWREVQEGPGPSTAESDPPIRISRKNSNLDLSGQPPNSVGFAVWHLNRMAITFREAVAEVELGLVSGDHLTDIATAGLLEGYESPALATLAGQFGEPYDPVQAERLWTAALDELHIPFEGTTAAAKLLVRAPGSLRTEKCRHNSAPARWPVSIGSSRMPAATRSGSATVSARAACSRCSSRTMAMAISMQLNATA